MKLNPDDETNHGKLKYYLSKNFPDLASNPTILSALVKHGALTKSQAVNALLYGTPPLVLIKDLSGGSCGGVSALGCTRNSTEIEVDSATVDEFENDTKSNIRQTTRGRDVFLLGVTILHELCHWGHNLNGKAEVGHAGDNIENALYGRVIV
jgi:Metallopeptidase toxin 3